MKRLLSLLLLLFLLLCSCGKENINVKHKNLSFCFDFEYNKSTYSLKAQVNDGGDIKYTVLKPENIKGMEFELFGTTCKINFLGIEKEYPIEYMGKSVLSRMHKAFYLLSSGEAKKGFNSNKVTVSDGAENYSFTVTELSIPIALEFQNYKIEFKNISEE